MSELNGEKIDIIPWSPDPATYISSAISPANVISIDVNDNEHKATVEVANDQLSLAIGKGGQNVRLAAKLTGWRIDIKSAQTGEVKEVVESEDVLDDGIVDDGTEA
jgi:N utilization substance protein A